MKKIIVLISTVPFLFGLTACSQASTNNTGEQSTNSTVNRSEAQSYGYAAIIDVRTIEEWEAGHLEGAVRYGIESPDFVSDITTLDKSADYYIYCRSGNRAGQAIQIMREAGFTGELVNGGAVENASQELNLPIVN